MRGPVPADARVAVACCLWSPTRETPENSRCFTEKWVLRLLRGFQRNLTVPFDFYCFVDVMRDFGSEPIRQIPLARRPVGFHSLIEPFSLGVPTIICGLDTVVVDNVDHLAHFCLQSSKMALPRDPYDESRSINAVALVPGGFGYVHEHHRGENDMEWLRGWPWMAIDDLWPGHLLSLKQHDVRRKGLQGAKIIYFHGHWKPHQLTEYDWVKRHWIGDVS